MLSSLISDSGSKPAAPEKKGTLLIVDDEEGPRQSLRVVFKGDYNLHLASDGSQALEIIQQHKVDVALIDIRMSGMSGIQVLEKIKALQPGIQVIMLTAYETIDTIRQALRLGACEYLNKPFDIATVRKAVASAMEQHSLTEQIQANNEKLAALQAELKNQKMQEEMSRSRGEIYASIIHDLNGPLTVISGYISLIDQQIGDSRQLADQATSEVKDRLKVITYQVNNCVEISHRYLSFMRQRTMEASQVRMNQILTDLQHLLKVRARKGVHQLEIQSLPEDVILPVNGTDLIQILLNLCNNALQSSQTPLKVSVLSRVTESNVSLPQIQDGPNDRVLNWEAFHCDGPALEIRIQDNGPGITPEVLAQLFQNHITTKIEGTGLGLSIVLRLLNECKGALHLHSKVGEGTNFTIYLPVTKILTSQQQ